MRRNPDTLAFYRKRLPYWEVAHGAYFITIHLSGAIPAKELRLLRAELRACPESARRAVERRPFGDMERWLDMAQPVGHLTRPEVESRRIVEYVRNNPVRAGLVSDYRNWRYGSWAGSKPSE